MKKINKKNEGSSIPFIIVAFCFLILSLSQSYAADVTLSVGEGSGAPGATDIPVSVSLENSDHRVKAVQLLIQDVDDHLIYSGCEPTDRTAGFECSGTEIIEKYNPYEPDEIIGCGRVVLYDEQGEVLIEEGTGAIFTILYDVSEEAPAGECRDLNLINELEEWVYTRIYDENNQELDVAVVSGEFCFNGLGTTTTTVIINTSTTTTVTDTSTTTMTDISTTTTVTDTSTTTTGPAKYIELTPESVWRSRWIPLPYLMFIAGEGTHFKAFDTSLAFEPPKTVFPLWPLVLSETYIWDIIWVMPSWLAGKEDQTVTVTVATGSEVVSGDFTIRLLPLILDQNRSLQ